MPDAVGLIKAIKRAAIEAVRASKPVEICFGKVTSNTPLKILVEQKMTLGEAQLVLGRNVTDYETYISGGTPDTGTLPAAPSDIHAVGKMQVTVHRGLVAGDEVILLRQQGGQKYVVVDKIG